MDFTLRGDIVYLSGDIDENSNFSAIKSDSPKVRFDMSGVRIVNSSGVREWILWLARAAFVPQYLNCPPAVVMQLNMVPQLLGKGGSVESLWLPTRCPMCQKQHVLLLRSGHEFMPGQIPEVVMPPCSADGTQVVADVDLEEYLDFVGRLS